MFKKLPIKFNHKYPDIESLRGELTSDYGGLKYYDLKSPELMLGQSVFLLKANPDRARLVELQGNSGTLPHTDRGSKTQLNMYVKTGFATTKFWEPKQGAVPEGRIWTFEKVKPVSSFTAMSGDVFLLDVSQLHSVACMTKHKRQFVQLSWIRRGFADVLAEITSLNQMDS